MYLVLSAGVSLAYLTGRPVHAVRGVRDHADRVVRAHHPAHQRTDDPGRDDLRDGEPAVVAAVPHGRRPGLRGHGTVNLADLAERVDTLPPGLRTVLALMLLVVFGIKAAMVPLHFWLPDSYPNAPAPVAALFAGLLTKVSFYAMLRTQTLVFPRRPAVDADAVAGRGHHDRRSARRAGPERHQPAPVVPAGQPHRVHALRARGLRRQPACPAPCSTPLTTSPCWPRCSWSAA